MEGIENLGAFCIAFIILIITPGSDTLFILTRSIALGKRAGILTALGINGGTVIHTLLVSFGLSAIIAQSPLLFNLIKYLGAFYLVYLGIRTLFLKGTTLGSDAPDYGWDRRIFLSGVLNNLLNPKVALFFLAFLPQFVNIKYAHSPYPFLTLGIIFISLGVLWTTLIASLASRFSQLLRTNQRFSKWLNRASGAVFILLGLKIAFIRRAQS